VAREPGEALLEAGFSVRERAVPDTLADEKGRVELGAWFKAGLHVERG